MNWRYPAEWEPHAATWISWPCRLEIWPNYAATCTAYAAVVNAIIEFEPVNLIVPPQYLTMAKKLCSGQVNFLDLPLNDSWTRDTLPIFLNNGNAVKALVWQFNAWGNKFSPYDQDAKLASRVSDYLKIETAAIPMILEGGSINTNGRGSLLTTKQCLLHPNRNPKLNQDRIEKSLKEQLYLQQIIWLNQGLAGDIDTDGHVDNIACFISDNEVLIQACYDRNDPNYAVFHDNYEILKTYGLTVHQIEQPPAVYYKNNRLPLSYLNFYFINDGVLIPSFKNKIADDKAYNVFKELFPKRSVMQIDASDIIVGGGGIHCMTMQQANLA